MTRPIPSVWYAVDILNGQRPFPTFTQKPQKGEGFEEVLDKAMEEKPWEKENVKSASITSW